jgi:hypothetical protein
MGDHLPECPADDPVGGIDAAPCWCDRLRACEARVREGNDRVWDAGWDRGFNAGRDAARDAVAAVRDRYMAEWDRDWFDQALAAIDALGGQR